MRYATSIIFSWFGLSALGEQVLPVDDEVAVIGDSMHLELEEEVLRKRLALSEYRLQPPQLGFSDVAHSFEQATEDVFHFLVDDVVLALEGGCVELRLVGFEQQRVVGDVDLQVFSPDLEEYLDQRLLAN